MVIRNYCVCIFISRRIFSYSDIQFYLYLASKLWYFMLEHLSNPFHSFIFYHWKIYSKIVIIKKTHLSKNGSSSSSTSSVSRSCQGCTSVLTVLKPGFRIRIKDQWIRIRIRNPDPDPCGQKWPTKVGKNLKLSCFEVLDVHLWELKAFSVTWTCFMEA